MSRSNLTMSNGMNLKWELSVHNGIAVLGLGYAKFNHFQTQTHTLTVTLKVRDE